MMVAVVSNRFSTDPKDDRLTCWKSAILAATRSKNTLVRARVISRGAYAMKRIEQLFAGTISWSWRNIVHFVERGKSARQFDH